MHHDASLYRDADVVVYKEREDKVCSSASHRERDFTDVSPCPRPLVSLLNQSRLMVMAVTGHCLLCGKIRSLVTVAYAFPGEREALHDVFRGRNGMVTRLAGYLSQALPIVFASVE